MTNTDFNQLTAELPQPDRDDLRERACIIAEGSGWPDEIANDCAWKEYLNRQPQKQDVMRI